MELDIDVTRTLRCVGCGSDAIVVNKTRLNVMEIECADCGKIRYRHFDRDKSPKQPGTDADDQRGA
jgi:uncharacterized Zn finger protein